MGHDSHQSVALCVYVLIVPARLASPPLGVVDDPDHAGGSYFR